MKLRERQQTGQVGELHGGSLLNSWWMSVEVHVVKCAAFLRGCSNFSCESRSFRLNGVSYSCASIPLPRFLHPTPASGTTNGGTFAYLIAAVSKEALQKQEKEFGADAQFKEDYAASNKKHGKLRSGVTAQKLIPANFSKLK